MPHPLDLLSEPRLIDLVFTLVSIPSVTGHEQRIADWTFDFLHALHFDEVRRLPVAEAGDTIVGWINGPATRQADHPVLMLNFHLDTFAAFAGWQSDPFTPRIEGDRLYALGAHDMKGGAACLLATVEAIVRSGIKLGGKLIVSATSDEENWSRGAHALIKSGLIEGCDYCLVPEPSDAGTLTIGQRGRHVFRLQFFGRTIHAAFGRGINAVADAAKVAALLHDPATVDLGYNADFNLPGSLTVIGLHGGGTLILVPEHAELFIDRHILPGQTVEEAAVQIRAVVEHVGIESRYQLTWDERPTPAPGPFLVPPTSHFVQTVKRHLETDQGQPIRYVLGRSVADTSHIAVHGAIPTLICGPQGGNTCEANEYVQISSLLPTARVYVKTVLEILGSMS